jgi:TonB family protein
VPSGTGYFRDFAPFSSFIKIHSLTHSARLQCGKHGKSHEAGNEEKKVYFDRHARSRWIRPLAFICLLVLFLLSSYQFTLAQSTGRKIKTKTEPEYPELARKNNISGSVRLELLVTTDGKVKNVKVLGGNPVLVQAAVAAVTKWKYEPATEESTIVEKIVFQ